MTRFINDKNEFGFIFKSANTLINAGAEFPDYVFSHKYRNIRVMEYNRAIEDIFLAALMSYCRKKNIPKMWFVMLDPHPEHGYFNIFKKYGVIEIDCHDSIEEVIRALWESPDGNPPGHVYLITRVFVLFSMDLGWCIFGDNDPECAVIAFYSRDELDLLINEMPKDESGWIKTPEDALTSFMKLPFRNRVIPDDFKEKFVENYIARTHGA